ncbi:MAG: glycerol-3-phosphate dehydrogenase [Hyphomicrobiaceae bacterium]
MYDIAIIGGGINGCGIARDAAGRGLSVLLAEKGDLASGTSSASTKLIHGGLRYLEHYEFRLVREALAEREVLLGMAPHIAWPLRFVLPHHDKLRPAWMIRIGLFLYDHLGGRRILPASRRIDLSREPSGAPLKPAYRSGFEYSDCWVDDARLVVLNAIDAKRRGADIRVRTEVVHATRANGHWLLELEDKTTGAQQTAEARMLVNAAGPWVGEVLKAHLGVRSRGKVRLVKGSHIVVPKLFDHDRAYIFQNADRRIVFAIPYERDFTLIGTTDVDYAGDPADVAITPDEITYLCAAVSGYFNTPVEPSHVRWTYSGVRPLYDDGSSAAQEATRDFVLELDAARDEAPLLNVFGGKITTYRRLAEGALDKLKPHLRGKTSTWTAGATLPGGDFPVDGFPALLRRIRDACPGLGEETASRLARTYGTTALELLGGASSLQDLGIHFGAGLTEREVRHLVENEWARTAGDILWRRTKLGLRLDAAAASHLAQWLDGITRSSSAVAAGR